MPTPLKLLTFLALQCSAVPYCSASLLQFTLLLTGCSWMDCTFSPNNSCTDYELCPARIKPQMEPFLPTQATHFSTAFT